MTTLNGFICYARDDLPMVELLHGTHLAPVCSTTGIDFWRDLKRIEAGEKWDNEIAAAIEAANVFLLLFSPAWLASAYIQNTELPAIRRRVTGCDALVIPVLLSECLHEGVIGPWDAIPLSNGRLKPIDEWRPAGKGKGHIAAARAIQSAIQKRFGVTLARFDWEKKAADIQQNPRGPIWVVRSGRLGIAAAASETDRNAALDPLTRVLHQRVRDKAEALWDIANREGNDLFGEFRTLPALARRFADAAKPETETLADRLLSFWGTFGELAEMLAKHRKIVAAEPDTTQVSMPLGVARDLGELIAVTIPFLHRFPSVREYEAEATLRAVPTQAQIDEAEALLVQALQADAIEADAQKMLADTLRPRGANTSGDEFAVAFVMDGARNLMVKLTGLYAAERAGHTEDLALSHRAASVLAWADGKTGAMLSFLSFAERHAVEAAMAVAAGKSNSSPPGVLLAGPAQDPFWATGTPPTWAHDWGHDEHGPWCSFRVPDTELTQRLRWCPPGTFIMGSTPETDPDRNSDEGPAHEVTFAQGFWMFDTACTEALWTAVTGQPPRHTRGPAFPVTTISWTEAQDFARRLNDALPGLSLGLPSEAAWEYACRAGTQTQFNFAGRLSRQRVRYNSGSPVPAGSLPPNRWGFFEMHGNVWEWCEDGYVQDYDGAPTDGAARAGTANRAIRGGSWNHQARGVRSAVRTGYGPSVRDNDLGFRCSRVQTSDRRSAGGVAAPADRSSAAKRGAPQADRAVGAATPPERGTARRPVQEKPRWAEKAGTDRFGTWADLAVPTGRGRFVRQRLRLIRPGTFAMGSPDDEPGRWVGEGPVHTVRIAQPFWLFNTPCTQALWRAVTGDNPSFFKSPTRPVEQVSFEDVTAFLTRVNDRVKDANLTLPSEAQWEYACRAGTKDATYAGPIEILGDNDAPVLDPIAWYGGNSGLDYDLRKGIGTGDWKGKQYDHMKAGTRKVKEKQPNNWGLYDMLGNVWEWCEGAWASDHGGAPTDGSARPASKGAADRTIRGGSWDSGARDVRSAVRNGSDPSDRDYNLGFRCSRVQTSD